jgi:hypothetical protein
MDIVERLRRHIADTHSDHLLCYEAADEIERLRAALREIAQMWAGTGHDRTRPYDQTDKAAKIAIDVLGGFSRALEKPDGHR